MDVQQVIPLPEAGEHVVKARESSRDFTRYDVTIGGVLHERQPKRWAIHLVAKALCSKGATPDEISEVLHWKGRNVWRSTEGIVDAEEFAAKKEADARTGGLVWDQKRWHRNGEGLIHADGKTWALSNQWDGHTGAGMRELLARWPESGVVVSESAD